MSVRRFYLLQCPASYDVSSIDDCHRHAEKVTFALLYEYFRSFHGTYLPNCLQTHIKVVASQVSREPNKDQWRVDNPQHCGHCLLHAVCGEFIDHHLLDPLTKARETTCILVLTPNPVYYGSTFGLVVHSQSRYLRRIQFTPYPKFYHDFSLRGHGLVSDVAQQDHWSTMGLWAGIESLADLFRTTKRPQRMSSYGWSMGLTLLGRMWMPTSKLDIEKTFDDLPPIAVAIFELGRWNFESVCQKPRIATAEDSRHDVITLAPQFISGVSQWSDIKTDRAFIHANRMWIVLSLMDAIDQFVKSIQKQGGNVSVQGNTRSSSSKVLAAQVRSYKMPEKLRQQQKVPWITHETIQRLKTPKSQ